MDLNLLADGAKALFSGIKQDVSKLLANLILLDCDISSETHISDSKSELRELLLKISKDCLNQADLLKEQKILVHTPTKVEPIQEQVSQLPLVSVSSVEPVEEVQETLKNENATNQKAIKNKCVRVILERMDLDNFGHIGKHELVIDKATSEVMASISTDDVATKTPDEIASKPSDEQINRRRCSSSSSSKTDLIDQNADSDDNYSLSSSASQMDVDDIPNDADVDEADDERDRNRNVILRLIEKINFLFPSSQSEGSVDEEAVPEKKAKRKRKRKHLVNGTNHNDDSESNDSAAKWRRDPLLRKPKLSDEDINTKDSTDVSKFNSSTSEEEGVEVSHVIMSGESSDGHSDDIEIVERNVLKSMDLLPTAEKERRISISSKDSSSSDIECVGIVKSPDKSRKNIRSILSDEMLMESTQAAKQAEMQREKRLQELVMKLELAKSQSQKEWEDEGIVLDVNDKGDISIKVHKDVTKLMKPHQVKGLEFMWQSCFESVEQISKSEGSGCILAHSMGLGKTLQVTALLHTLGTYRNLTKVKRVMILCPFAVIQNWLFEHRRVRKITTTEPLKIYVIKGEVRNTREQIITQWYLRTGICVMSYEAYSCMKVKKGSNGRVVEYLNSPDLVIFDEGHMLKNHKNIRYQSLADITTKRRIILTGTPMQNNLAEYFYMVQIIKPSLLGSFAEFQNRFTHPITNGQYDDSNDQDIRLMRKRSHILHEILKNTVQRFEVSTLENYLQVKHDYALFITVHPLQRELCEKFLNKLKEDNSRKNSLFEHYNHMLVLWTHPYIYLMRKANNDKKDSKQQLDMPTQSEILSPTDFPSDVSTNLEYGSKYVVVLKILQHCLAADDKVLLFSTFLYTLDVMEMFLKQANDKSEFKWVKGRTYLRLDGKVEKKMRNKISSQFNQDNNVKLLMLSTKIGALGLNFPAANRVILMDVSWNPASDEQSVFRIYRFGQMKPCFVYRLIARGLMEEVVYRRSLTKRAVAHRVVDEHQIDRHFKSIELADVYSFSHDPLEPRPLLKVPADNVLASVLQECTHEIFSYKEHQEQLMNRPDEELSEVEINEAWAEFNEEKTKLPPLVQVRQDLAAPVGGRSVQAEANPTQIVPPVLDYLKMFMPSISSTPMSTPAVETVIWPRICGVQGGVNVTNATNGN